MKHGVVMKVVPPHGSRSNEIKSPYHKNMVKVNYHKAANVYATLIYMSLIGD